MKESAASFVQLCIQYIIYCRVLSLIGEVIREGALTQKFNGLFGPQTRLDILTLQWLDAKSFAIWIARIGRECAAVFASC